MRKDVGRSFRVLQAHFAFVKRPCLIWDKLVMDKTVMACIIMHNMIAEDERDAYQNYYDLTAYIMERLVNRPEKKKVKYMKKLMINICNTLPNALQAYPLI